MYVLNLLSYNTCSDVFDIFLYISFNESSFFHQIKNFGCYLFFLILIAFFLYPSILSTALWILFLMNCHWLYSHLHSCCYQTWCVCQVHLSASLYIFSVSIKEEISYAFFLSLFGIRFLLDFSVPTRGLQSESVFAPGYAATFLILFSCFLFINI